MGVLSRWHARWSDRRLAARVRAAGAAGPALPAAARDYGLAERPSAADRPLGAGRYVVFDTETTGLDHANDRLLTIGGVAIVDGAVRVDDSVELVVAGDEVGRQAAPVHGMTRRDLAAGQSLDAVLTEFLAWIGQDVVVAHHLAFDQAVIDRALAATLPPLRLRNPGLDTAVLARRLAGAAMGGAGGAAAPGADGTTAHAPSRWSLDALCAAHGIQVHARHHAVGDALATAELALVLFGAARRRGLTTLGRIVPDA